MGYHALEGKALAECERGLQSIRAVPDGPLFGGSERAVLAGLGQVGFGLAVAVLAVADRLDRLIDCLFDERLAVRVEGAGESHE